MKSLPRDRLEKHYGIMIWGRAIYDKRFKIDSMGTTFHLALFLAPFVDGVGNLLTKGVSLMKSPN